MIRQTFFLGLVLGLLSQICNAQISFIEFEQEQCGLISSHGYTYENIPLMCGSHSSGYKIYLGGEQIFEKCIEFGGCSVIDIMFVNETTGFIVERNPNGHTVYKTRNSGVVWSSIGGGSTTYLGFYVVNSNTGYLLTTWDTPLNLYITRVSDINQYYYSDTNINQNITIDDTIFGTSFCEFDYLSFKIKNSNDTIGYQISFSVETVSEQQLIRNIEIAFYPNPCKDFIFFSEKLDIKEVKYQILDLSGKVLKIGVLDNNHIYVGNLRRGFYLVQLIKDKEEYFGKIIK